jgi:hypothetical protein
MRIAYFDCFAGASGDMILGALLDAGVPLEHLNAELAKLGLGHFDIQASRVERQGLGGCQALVQIDEQPHRHHHRRLSDIRTLIASSGLDPAIKESSVRIFQRLAEAEAKVHRTTPEAVHFHEVGAMDAIIDVVGACIGVKALAIDRLVCSPLHVGGGTVTCAHGTLPVPAPATAELVKGRPIYATDLQGELLTPTGAAILTTLAADFGPMPAMILETVGYGAGMAERSLANLLRLFIGTASLPETGFEIDQTAVIETTIDDMNPQLYDFLIEKTLQLGALDIFFAPVQMKKNRCGTLLTVLCPPEAVSRLSEALFRQSTTIGLRWRVDQRIKLPRKMLAVDTRFGPVVCKAALLGERIVTITPEYDVCRRLAQAHNVPLKTVLDEARAKALAAGMGMTAL